MSWNSRRHSSLDEVDLSEPNFGDQRSRSNNSWDYGQQYSPSYQQQQQQQQQYGQQYGQPYRQYTPQNQQQQPFRSAPEIRNEKFNNYSNILQQQGIPAISPEDLKILQDCSRESLYSRCLPLTAALCAGLLFTAQQRQFKPKYFHYLGAVILGYIGGKISYRTKCEDKLISSKSNSPFVNSIRKRRGIMLDEFQSEDGINQNVTFESDWATHNQVYGGDDTGNQLNRENDYSGNNLNEMQRSQSTFGSYDELRQRNRNNFKNV